jgi:hypothetical protein
LSLENGDTLSLIFGLFEVQKGDSLQFLIRPVLPNVLNQICLYVLLIYWLRICGRVIKNGFEG